MRVGSRQYRSAMPIEALSRVIEGIYPSRTLPAMPWAARFAGDDYGLPAIPRWRELDWSQHVRRTWIAGRAVNYVDLGGGSRPPAVFVHGLGGNWQNWLENLPRVARERRAVALDLPGFGGSEMPAEPISIAGYARLVDALCDQLDLGPVAVVGSSMGGFIGAELAISFPERVDRLVLAAAAGISSTNLRRRPTVTAARVSRPLGMFGAARSRELVARPRLRYLALSSVVRHPARVDPALLYEMLRGAGKPGYVQALDAVMSYDFRDRLPEIGCPVLVIWGAQDMIVPVKDADEFERLIPDARKTVLVDTGHAPMLERPRTFNEALLEFLNERGEAASGRSRAA